MACSSGWIGDPEKTDVPEGSFASDFRTWTLEGWRRFDALCDHLLAMADLPKPIFLPHHRHVLSDPQACMIAIKRWSERSATLPFRILVEPAGFLSAGMLGSADDHLRRAFESLTHPQSLARPWIAGVVLSDVRLALTHGSPGAEPEAVVTELGHGVLGADRVLTAFGRWCDPTLPVILRSDDPDAFATRIQAPRPEAVVGGRG